MTMIATNITDLKREYYKLAKEMNINMISSGENEIEIYEKDRIKGYRFAEEVNKLNNSCKVVDLIAMGMDKDARGNTLEGSQSLYLTDDEYYLKLIGEEVGQVSMF